MCKNVTIQTPAKRRWPAALGIGLAAVLTLVACTGPVTDGGGNEERGTDTGAVSPSPTESAMESLGPTASSKESTTGEQHHHFTEDGIFRWTLPAGWTANPVELPDGVDPNWAMGDLGMPHEHSRLRNADQSIVFEAETGDLNVRHDRPWPEFIEVLDAEHMPEVPQPDAMSGEVWYRAVLVRPEEFQQDASGYELWVTVGTSPSGNPINVAADEYIHSWAYITPRIEGYKDTGSHQFFSHIGQDEAEQITGEEGKDAVIALLDTEEYAELRDMATSMAVQIP